MKILKKIYLEITNVCNLNCSFCKPHDRKPAFMSRDKFDTVIDKIEGKAEVLYFHVKGEPLMHPDLAYFIERAGRAGFRVQITTNGTLLETKSAALESSPYLDRLNISLHNSSSVIEKTLAAAEKIYRANSALNPSFLVSYRIWTRDNEPVFNRIVSETGKFYGIESGKIEASLELKKSCILHDRVALHAETTFSWPALDAPDCGERGFCRALRDQAGILVDGTVIPCCLDGDGVLALGNLFQSDWNTILASPRARAIYRSFTDRIITEPLCRHCGYRTKFDKA